MSLLTIRPDVLSRTALRRTKGPTNTPENRWTSTASSSSSRRISVGGLKYLGLLPVDPAGERGEQQLEREEVGHRAR